MHLQIRFKAEKAACEQLTEGGGRGARGPVGREFQPEGRLVRPMGPFEHRWSRGGWSDGWSQACRHRGLWLPLRVRASAENGIKRVTVTALTACVPSRLPQSDCGGHCHPVIPRRQPAWRWHSDPGLPTRAAPRLPAPHAGDPEAGLPVESRLSMMSFFPQGYVLST